MADVGYVMVVDPDGVEIGRLPAEDVPIDYPGMGWRADPATGAGSDGRLYTAVYGRLYTSVDRGRSWNGRLIEFDGFTASSGFGVLPDDTLVLLYGMPPDERGVHDFAVARSTDTGATWEPGAPLERSPYTGSAGADGQKFCVLADGTAIVAVDLRNGDAVLNHDGTELPVEKKGMHDQVYRSTDGGLTWGDRTPIMPDSSESNFLAMGGDRVLAAIRVQRSYPRPDDPPELWKQTGGSPKMVYKHIFLADSDDGGRTWQDFRQWTKKVGDCPGELVRVSDGRIVLIHCSRYPNERGHVRARVSADEGRTWSAESYIVSVGSGYSGSIVLDDDTIVTVCGNTRLKPATRNYISPNANAEPWKMHAVRWRLPER